MNKAKVGRPRVNGYHRAALISSARELFIEQDFDLVSVRKIAKKAGTDPALIRYYFGSKLGLFVAMMKETMEPITKVFFKIEENMDINQPKRLMTLYYQTMAKYPNFPRLVYRLACTSETAKNREVIEVFNELFEPQEIIFFEVLKRNGLLGQDVDAQLARISFISLLIFPFIMPNLLQSKLGIDITPDFLSKLAAHNTALISHGIMNGNTSK
ncbi:TetR/AcrR family transcriptional regulator [uncultured Shewanella sp.]|uniref:TetR/AcrR family transcriptional regulator n=1 Tax=uncultured Shewanella sp. TaxID=173975 RepID=UPI002632A81C|nr:TetR/AcrR family transcriptional regulator [uncultured Shewanella sp.]